jgi:TetR/AcrR family transcriptional regulator, regulator of cefoperazone and chloramphenicol sensitivity
MKTVSAPSRGDATRQALIAAALRIFGRDGFHAASTRAIAEAAGVNLALIRYHFGGKQALYLAVFEHIAAQVMQRQRPAIEAMEAVLAAPDDAPDESARRARYLPPLLGFVDGMAAMLTSRESAAWAQLILREQQAPTSAFALLYERLMGPVLGLLTRLLQRLHGTRADVRLQVATTLGQALVFRAAHAAMLRLMGWREIGDVELAAIQQQIRRNLTAELTQPWRTDARRGPVRR